MEIQEVEWESSYHNRNNFLFYPHEEVIRFVSKNIRRRVGLNEFYDVSPSPWLRPPRILDLGCGIGRHVIFCHQFGLDAYGVDLSAHAVSIAVKWGRDVGMEDPERRVVQGDVRNLQWEDGFFDFALSHGVLDSMHFEVARSACEELFRVMAEGGLFYCDLVSGDDSAHAREYEGEETVSTEHEKGTVQSYFNYSKINRMINGLFDLEEAFLVKRENVVKGGYSARHHLVLRRK